MSPRNHRRKKTNQLNFHQLENFHLAQVKKAQLPSISASHFKWYLLNATDRCTCMYLHAIINTSPSLLSKLLILRTLKKKKLYKTLHINYVPLLRLFTTQVILFSSMKVVKLIFSHNSQLFWHQWRRCWFSHWGYLQEIQCNWSTALYKWQSIFPTLTARLWNQPAGSPRSPMAQLCKKWGRADECRRQPPSLQNVSEFETWWGFGQQL